MAETQTGRPVSSSETPTGTDKVITRRYPRRRKVCKFCVEKIDDIDYKNVELLSQFITERGRIIPARLTGVCAPHQRQLTRAIKQARIVALLPFVAEV